MRSIPDEELVRQFQANGIHDCFAELFSRYRKKVFCSCRGFFADTDRAEDATQETFLRAYQNMHRFAEGDFCGWLMRIARNVCIDEWRKRRPERVAEPEEAALLPTTALEPSSGLRLTVQQLFREMDALSPEQRQCLQMKIEGYSYEETAARTGLPLNAVKSHLQNGRRMLWVKMGATLSLLG